MPAMTEAEKHKAARVFARQAYDSSTPATLSHADVVDAIDALDSAMEGPASSLPDQSQSVAQNFNTQLPAVFKSQATLAHKSLLLAVWTGVKYGFISSGGE